MPICTTCTHPVPHLYTLYPSKYNLRLEQCPKCSNFADPYVEHDPLIVLLDLILLKRGVYRHLLFNYGARPRRLDREGREVPVEDHGAQSEWDILWKLGLALVAVDAFIRWSDVRRARGIGLWDEERKPYGVEDYVWTKEAAWSLGRMFAACLVETLAFHAGVVLASWTVLSLVRVVQRSRSIADTDKSTSPTMRRISLSLLYSSLTKLFLLLLLSIWHTRPPARPPFSSLLPSRPLSPALLPWLPSLPADLLSDRTLDRAWIIRHLLGGFSAGFGLRVVLDCHPVLTTGVVLCAWALEGWVRSGLQQWSEG
ncbi:Arv1-domain-containing protein [Calocera cornea HHB12733]|uniref:Protein ARV n=1 Tax=Calocera cornea HHB12733 TaxID=1353952 RepID=A0A165HDF1_9BASI|nr:Arv1-domain-containing protein [Calocera cornea HHB12733]